jgi:hypothetical protein
LRGAYSGDGNVVMVAGDPGVGKTALAHAMEAEATATGTLVVWAHAWEGEGAPAYWHWQSVVQRLAASLDIAPALGTLSQTQFRCLAYFAPVLGRPSNAQTEFLPAPARAHLDGEEPRAVRLELIGAITSLLCAVASDRPLVVILDDLDGADHASLLLLQSLATQMRDSQIFVIGTYCEAKARVDAQLAGTLSDIIRHGQRLPLRGLREHDVAEVVELVTGSRTSDTVTRAIHRATQGRPLLVEAAASLLRSGDLDQRDAEQFTAKRVAAAPLETIHHRLEPLLGSTRALLCAAAVVGREFRLETLQRVCRLDAGAVGQALGDALDNGVIVEHSRGGESGGYGFSNGLIREVFYEELGPRIRGQLHRDIGLALEELYLSDTETHVVELAHHFFVGATAGEVRKAIEYSIRAGRRAVSLAAYDEAAAHFERALLTSTRWAPSDTAQCCDLLLELGSAQSRAGHTRSARDTFVRAASFARTIPSPDRLARAALGYGAGMGGFEFGCVDDDLVTMLEDARDALGDGDSPLLARVLARLATELYFSDRARERNDLAKTALTIAHRVGDRATTVSALGARFFTLCGPESSVERLQIASDAVALGEEVRDRKLILRGHFWRILSLMECGHWRDVDRELDLYGPLARELRDPLHLWHVPLFLAARALMHGHLDDAEHLSAKAFTVGRGAQAQNAAQLHAVQLFALRAEQGRLREVAPRLAEYGGKYPASPAWRAASAYALTMSGQTGRARLEFEALTANDLAAIPRDRDWLACVALLIRCGAQLGDAARCSELSHLLAPYADRAVTAGQGAICLGPASRFAGIAATTAGRRREATEYLVQALDTARRWRSDPLAAAIAVELDRASGLGYETRDHDDFGRHRLAPSNVDVQSAHAYRSVTYSTDAEFRQTADVWTIRYRGNVIQLRHAKGLAHIARLLASPQVEFSALDLAVGHSARQGIGITELAIASSAEVQGHAGGGGIPLLDDQAKTAFRERIAELREELEQAESFNDPERAAQARAELAFVAGELAAAVGLGGRDRRPASDSERARVNVTRAIRTALKRIAAYDSDLGRSLNAAIRTGAFCVYEPAPGEQLTWHVSSE